MDTLLTDETAIGAHRIGPLDAILIQSAFCAVPLFAIVVAIMVQQ